MNNQEIIEERIYLLRVSKFRDTNKRRLWEGRPKIDNDLRLKGWRMGKRTSHLEQLQAVGS